MPHWGTSRSIPIFLTTLTALSSFAHAQQTMTLRGSDALIYLGQRFAEMYARTHPASFEIHGGGIPPALAAVTSGQASVAQFEGSPKNLDPSLLSFPIGVQGIVVYVNQANPVTELSLHQLRSIFTGEITNWKALGRTDLAIHLYAAESTTGTLSYFQDSVLDGQEPYPFVGKSNTKGLLEEIAAHREAIGYGSLDAAPGVSVVAIKTGPHSQAIKPTAEAIRSRRYPITRFVTWVASHKPPDALKEFYTWVLSSEGQLVVEGAGFQPLLPRDRAAGLAKFGGSSDKSACCLIAFAESQWQQS